VCIDGVESDWRRVISGVPQGSVLGPILFLIFINDLDSGLQNWILKFADDAKVFGRISSLPSAMALQMDLARLLQWASEWQMTFNVDKCKVMHIGKSNEHFSYYMDGVKLEKVSLVKDLGLLVSDDLKVSKQCTSAYSKGSQMLGMINRTIRCKTAKSLLPLYKTLVRPHLEYCTAAWSPYYQKDRELLERVQHRFTRMIPGFGAKTYENRLRDLGLWSLEERRNRADLVEVYKMWKGLSRISFDSFFEVDLQHRTRGHSLKLRKNRCRLDIRQHFFSERVVSAWNALDQQTIDSSSLNIFKKNLSRMRCDGMDRFMD